VLYKQELLTKLKTAKLDMVRKPWFWARYHKSTHWLCVMSAVPNVQLIVAL